jgi:hypothetical protein
MVMADYAGAVEAIEARLRERWAGRTPVAVRNGPEVRKLDQAGDPQPWVYLEVIGGDATILGVGRPGDHLTVDDGNIFVHVFVPSGTGTSEATRLAVAAGEIFRTAEFYRDTPGCCVRSWSPRIDGGGSSADDGLWWRVTATIPFEYIHRG